MFYHNGWHAFNTWTKTLISLETQLLLFCAQLRYSRALNADLPSNFMPWPGIPRSSDTSMMRFIGIDVGGTKCAVVLGDESGTTIDRRQFPTSGGPEATLERLTEITRSFVATTGDVAAIGISCGGPLDAARGLILSPPNLPGGMPFPSPGTSAGPLAFPSSCKTTPMRARSPSGGTGPDGAVKT
jgi:hypothetical protein